MNMLYNSDMLAKTLIYGHGFIMSSHFMSVHHVWVWVM